MNIKDNELCQIAKKANPFSNVIYSVEVHFYTDVLNMQLREYMGSFKQECSRPEHLRFITCKVKRRHS
jgi:hypothetical protein